MGNNTVSAGHAVHSGANSGVLTANPAVQSEIFRELNVQEELISGLVSELSQLAAAIEPVMLPAPPASTGQPVGSPCGSVIASRVNDGNNRLAYAIDTVRTLRTNIAL